MKTLGDTLTQTRNHPCISNEKNVKVHDPPKMNKYSSNVHQIDRAHLQCVNNHYEKFECKGMNTV